MSSYSEYPLKGVPYTSQSSKNVMKIYHPQKGERTIPSVDWSKAWERQGWTLRPVDKSFVAPVVETPPAVLTVQAPIKPHSPTEWKRNREAELEKIWQDEGEDAWRTIKALAEKVDVKKKDSGWFSTIPDIVEAESLQQRVNG